MVGFIGGRSWRIFGGINFNGRTKSFVGLNFSAVNVFVLLLFNVF